MARKKGHRKSKKKIPILATLGAVGTGYQMYDGYKQGDSIPDAMFGYSVSDGTMHWDRTMAVFVPVLVGVAGSAIASKLRLNRYLSGIPYIKL